MESEETVVTPREGQPGAQRSEPDQDDVDDDGQPGAARSEPIVEQTHGAQTLTESSVRESRGAARRWQTGTLRSY